MDKIVKMQNDALKNLCDILNKRYVAAKLVEEDRILSVLLPFEISGNDVFCDVFFLPQEERMGDVSFAGIRAEIGDVSELEGDKLFNLCMKLSIMNDTMPLGGYGTSASDDGKHLDKLVFTVTVPMTGSYDTDKMTEMLETTLTMTAQVIENTAEDVMSV